MKREFSNKIQVIGLGYVGYTLAAVLADVGYIVHGIDINELMVEDAKNANSHVKEPGLDTLIRKHIGRNLFIGTSNEMYEKDADALIVCVPSPINKKTKKINLNHVRSAVSEIRDHLKTGQSVNIRSTLPVGGTRNFIKPILEESGLRAGKDFHLSYTPERTIEGDAIRELRMLPQIIGGINPQSVEVSSKIFNKMTPTVIKVSSLEAAELSKLLNNAYRDVRFAFANEIAKYCEKAGLSAFEVINAANHEYPRNDIPVPSPGVGGTCLTKDPYILAECARQVGVNLPIIQRARQINENIPKRILERLKMFASLKNKRVFIAGFAFKGQPETNDIRESPTLDVVKYLQNENAQVKGYDPCVEEWKIRSLDVEYNHSIEEGVKDSDIIIFMTNNKQFYDLDVKKTFLGIKEGTVILDGWGLFKKNEIEEMKLKYLGVGIG